jgi:hypothetical protein
VIERLLSVQMGGGSMDAELIALGASGATTLVSLMATDAWNKAKTTVAKAFGRNSSDQQALFEELEAARQQVLEASEEPQSLEAASHHWQTRLIDLALTTAEPAKTLVSLVDELSKASQAATESKGPVNMKAEASDGGKIAQQVHGIQIIN